jgi:hypothetical protein
MRKSNCSITEPTIEATATFKIWFWLGGLAASKLIVATTLSRNLASDGRDLYTQARDVGLHRRK